jgi:hypothetical protein
MTCDCVDWRTYTTALRLRTASGIWGYAVCDAALRAHIDDALQTKLGIKIEPPAVFPFPGGY